MILSSVWLHVILSVPGSMHREVAMHDTRTLSDTKRKDTPHVD